MYKLVHNTWFEKITNTNKIFFKNIEHLTVLFVDDATSVITFPNTNQIQTYLESFYTLIEAFYSVNKLKINADKTALLLSHKPKFQNQLKNFHFRANKYSIYPKGAIKILGSYIESQLKLNVEIGKLTSCLHNRINEIKKLTPYTDSKTRLSFMNSQVIGKLNYMLPLYSHASAPLINKLHNIQMKAARTVIGSYCFMKNTKYILGKCKWLSIRTMITMSAVNNIHKIIFNRTPEPLYSLFRSNRRLVSQKHTIYTPKTKIFGEFYIYSGLAAYNKLPVNLKTLPPKIFKKRLKKIYKPAS